MSILIKNTEMPKSCNNCWALDDYGDYPVCRITEEQRGYDFPIREKRMSKCPLVPVPPHGDLIDRDALPTNRVEWEDLVPMDGANPIPRKGTTRHECYRALYEIQELLETRRYFGMHLPQTNADRIRAMTDEELANFIAIQRGRYCDFKDPSEEEYPKVLLWLKSPVEVDR